LVKVSVDRVRLLETTESSLHWKLKLFHFKFFFKIEKEMMSQSKGFSSVY
jgi:hypothetical protein